jgi:hypothetical protein
MDIRSFTGEKQPERGFDHLFLVPGCEWVGITPPLPLCACTGMSWNGLYLHYIIIYYFKKSYFRDFHVPHRLGSGTRPHRLTNIGVLNGEKY